LISGLSVFLNISKVPKRIGEWSLSSPQGFLKGLHRMPQGLMNGSPSSHKGFIEDVRDHLED
jgi:hypothetical protein